MWISFDLIWPEILSRVTWNLKWPAYVSLNLIFVFQTPASHQTQAPQNNLSNVVSLILFHLNRFQGEIALLFLQIF